MFLHIFTLSLLIQRVEDFKMATESPFPPIDIPEIDIWDFIFEGKRSFSDNQGTFITFRKVVKQSRNIHSRLRRRQNHSPVHIPRCQGHRNCFWACSPFELGLAKGRCCRNLLSKLCRHTCHDVRHSVGWWYCLACEPSIISQGTRIPAERLGGEGFGHPSLVSEYCTGSSEDSRITSKSDPVDG